MTRTGRCLCGEVQYELAGDLPPLVNCHCQYCRRAHGAAFVTIAWVPRSAFVFTAGEDSVTRHSVMAGEAYRCFCSACGSRLFSGSTSETGVITLVVSTLDDDSHPGPVLHLNLESKASWHVITDELPQYQRFSDEVVEYLRSVHPD